ncbi:MAG: hypothetical protein M3R64_08810 [Pseudomonadota bacterium]|nr:hypothetical protein [Pseudomonadota bacterium]
MAIIIVTELDDLAGATTAAAIEPRSGQLGSERGQIGCGFMQRLKRSRDY